MAVSQYKLTKIGIKLKSGDPEIQDGTDGRNGESYGKWDRGYRGQYLSLAPLPFDCKYLNCKPIS